ncbi:MAG: hypothetical protein KIH01_09110 [Candidatus Freyarchaeota archaeon]|nr:hypothetical protein [Candidatus Jordarchaeia archaeon]
MKKAGETEFQVYRRRWAVLASFCLVFFTTQLLWIEFATIPQTVAFAYGPFADQELITLLTIEGPLVSAILSFPCGAVIDKWGWKRPVGVTAGSLVGVLRTFASSNFTPQPDSDNNSRPFHLRRHIKAYDAVVPLQ